MPQHVYLVAYPNTLAIGVESTSEKKGVYHWSDYNKNVAIAFLIDIGKVQKEMLEIRTVESILKEHFYSNSNLNFENLVGIQFYNKALQCQAQKETEEALVYARSARKYYASDKNKMILGSILAELVFKTAHDDINIIDYISGYYNIVHFPARRDAMESMFRMVIEKAFNERRDLEFVDSSRVLITNNLSDEKDQNHFSSLIYLEEARWRGYRGENKLAFDAAINGYELNAENKIFEDIISFVLIDVLIENNYYAEEIDSVYSAYVNSYPFILDNTKFLNFYVGSYAVSCGDAFYRNRIEEAFVLKEKVESFLDDDRLDPDLVNDLLGNMYGDYSSYLFRKGEYNKAKKSIDKALEYNPHSNSLQNKRIYILEKL